MYPAFQRLIIVFICFWSISACSWFHRTDNMTDAAPTNAETVVAVEQVNPDANIPEKTEHKSVWKKFTSWGANLFHKNKDLTNPPDTAVVAVADENQTKVEDNNERSAKPGKWQSFKNWWSDTSITTSVKFKLIKDPYIDAINVKVITEGGVVTLSGYVQKPSDIERATDLTKSTEGVVLVVNKLLAILG